MGIEIWQSLVVFKIMELEIQRKKIVCVGGKRSLKTSGPKPVDLQRFGEKNQKRQVRMQETRIEGKQVQSTERQGKGVY